VSAHERGPHAGKARPPALTRHHRSTDYPASYAFVWVAFAHDLYRTLPAQFRQNTTGGAILLVAISRFANDLGQKRGDTNSI